MSLTSEQIRQAKYEALSSGASFAAILNAIEVLDRKIILKAAEERHDAWSNGRRGDTTPKVEGLSSTQTQLLRQFAAKGLVTHEEFPELYRHVSALRKRLSIMDPSIQIKTRIGQGHELIAGFDSVNRMLHAGATPTLRAAGFTAKETTILRILAERGSLHVDQVKCLQRHVSNIRKKLPRTVELTTHLGEGLYTVEKGRDLLIQIVSGEVIAAPKPARAIRKAKEPALLAA